jgi:hypothetical protein
MRPTRRIVDDGRRDADIATASGEVAGALPRPVAVAR